MNKPIIASMNHERYESARKLVEEWSVWHDHKQLVISVIDRAVRLEREVERLFDQSEATRLREALTEAEIVYTNSSSYQDAALNMISIISKALKGETLPSSHREDTQYVTEVIGSPGFGYNCTTIKPVIEDTGIQKVREYIEHLSNERDRTDIVRGRCHSAEYSGRIDSALTVSKLLGIPGITEERAE